MFCVGVLFWRFCAGILCQHGVLDGAPWHGAAHMWLVWLAIYWEVRSLVAAAATITWYHITPLTVTAHHCEWKISWWYGHFESNIDKGIHLWSSAPELRWFILIPDWYVTNTQKIFAKSLLCSYRNKSPLCFAVLIIPPLNEVEGGYTGFALSVCPSVRPSVHPSVHRGTESCPLWIFYNTHQIHFIFTHLIKQLQKVCYV